MPSSPDPPRRGRALALAAALSLLAGPGPANDFVVDTAADTADARPGDGVCADSAGACSLRAAMEEAVARFGFDRILFALPGPGPHVIAPRSALPDHSDFAGLTIDGTTQPGYAGTPIVELDGSAVPLDPGIRITGGHAQVRGLVIRNFGTHGITLRGSHLNVVQNCYIGTDRGGTRAQPNRLYGVYILDSQTNTIGGTAPGDGNLISGNGSDGVHISGATTSGNLVIGNRIGTDATGSLPLGNTIRGVHVSGAPRNSIGGISSAEANVVSASTLAGILLSGPEARQNLVLGNRIGTDISGRFALPNLWGVVIDNAPDNVIGGAAGAGGNRIAGNLDAGVVLQGSATVGNTLIGNVIGLDAAGNPLGNLGDGVLIGQGASSNIVGRRGPGDGNTISGNGGSGIRITDGNNNLLSGNAIGPNGSLGIDLGTDGAPTPNDPGDGDTGANDLQNFPVLTSASAGCANLQVDGTLDTLPSTSFVIELFASGACDPTGFGEAETYLGSTTVVTDATGQASFSVLLPVGIPANHVITATASQPLRTWGNSSELSACLTPANACQSCGNGTVEAGEECDTGGVDTPACDADCTFVLCGDRHVNLPAGEECDQGGVDTPGCDADCTFPVCGDGHRNPAAGEECDDSNTQSGDGCSSSCRIEYCQVAALARLVPLLAVKEGPDVRLWWPADGSATAYHVNNVSRKDLLQDPRLTPRGAGLPVCAETPPTVTCTDPDGIAAGDRLYQALSACGPTGDDEGPF